MDEINIVRPGAFYGWPDVLGFSTREEVEDPVWVYLNSVAPAGMVVYTGDALPDFTGDLFFCQFTHGGALHRVRFSDDFRAVESDTVIAQRCTTSVAQGPDGFLYFVDLDPRHPDNGALYRIVNRTPVKGTP
jgi:glucose/arabinose dehydrogenase